MVMAFHLALEGPTGGSTITREKPFIKATLLGLSLSVAVSGKVVTPRLVAAVTRSKGLRLPEGPEIFVAISPPSKAWSLAFPAQGPGGRPLSMLF